MGVHHQHDYSALIATFIVAKQKIYIYALLAAVFVATHCNTAATARRTCDVLLTNTNHSI